MSTGGLSRARLERMQDVLAGHVDRGVVPGVVTLLSRRGEVQVDAIGSRAFGDSDSMRRDTIFRVGDQALAATPGRYGWDGGYGTSWYVDPREELIGILMTQRLWDASGAPVVLLDFWTSVYGTIDD